MYHLSPSARMSANRLLRVFLCTLAALACLAHAGVAQEQVTLVGHLNRVWFDGSDADRMGIPYLMKTSDRSVLTAWVPLTLAQRHGGPSALDLKYVTLTAIYTDENRNVLRVESIEAVDSPPDNPQLLLRRRTEAQYGSKSYIILPSKFTDIATVPHPQSWFASMFTSNPGLDHYYREISYGQMNLAGSYARDWQTLPNAKANYLNSTATDYDLNKLFDDATMTADADVTFPDYFGVHIPINSGGTYSWGGSRYMDRDGVSRLYGATWMMDWADFKTYAHEMGHSLGLPHSSGPYDQVYDSRWDVMSGGYNRTQPGAFGAVPVHTIAYHKAKLGWIPASRQFVPTTTDPHPIYLERLAQPTSSTDYLMAKIPIQGQAAVFYTVEARRKVGYDLGIPYEGIVIHKVTLSDSIPAKVVDADNDGDPNDDGAVWNVGETFTDAVNGITVAVTSATSTGYNVTITSTSATVGDTVTNTGDSGPGSLRNALLWANENPGTTIKFAIPTTDAGYSGGVWTIRPLSALPEITGNDTLIDGSTQAAAIGDTNADGPEIVINGSQAGTTQGFRVRAVRCRIKQLVVNGFSSAGISISTAAANNAVIDGCYIGTDATGQTGVGNHFGVEISSGAQNVTVGYGPSSSGCVISGNRSTGVRVANAGTDSVSIMGNRIGTDPSGTRAVGNAGAGIEVSSGSTRIMIGAVGFSYQNVISGNGNNGVALWYAGTTDCLIQNNRIGTNLAGDTAIPNTGSGVGIFNGASGNTVGGPGGAGNTISGNSSYGIYINGTDTVNNRVEGNRIGVNAAGNSAVPNVSNGITISTGAQNNTIGGTQSGAGNTISGNGRNGIAISGPTTTGNQVLGNRIGLSISDTLLGNASNGIEISSGTHHNTIGQTDGSAANAIAGNTENGIVVILSSTIGNTIRGNRIWNNGRLGIDLYGGSQNVYGVTANDAGDGDTGANNLQNYPDINEAVRVGAQTLVSGSLSGRPNARVAIDLYGDTEADPSGYGEGHYYLGSTEITLNSSGSGSFAVSGAGGSLSRFSATATDLGTGDTSEFSPSCTVTRSVYLSALSLSPVTAAGGIVHPTGTVTLTGAAPTGGVVVTLSSSNTAAATVPASVTVPQGQSQATFAVTSKEVPASAVVTIGAANGTVTRTATLTVSPGYTGFLSRDIALAPDGSLRVLQVSNGYVRIARVTGASLQAGAPAPIPADWTPVAIAVGPDLKTRLLWSGPGGAVSVMTFTASGARESYQVVGTFAGVISKDIAVAGDGSIRILQTSASLVRILKIAGTSLQYGPAVSVPSGWSPTAIAAGPDNKTRLLWNGPGGAVSVMTFTASGARESYQALGVYAGVASTDIAVASDNSVRILQVSSTLARILKVSGSSLQFGPALSIPAGWMPVAIASGSDDKTRLLWRNGGGMMGVMTMNGSGAREAYVAMGPF